MDRRKTLERTLKPFRAEFRSQEFNPETPSTTTANPLTIALSLMSFVNFPRMQAFHE